MPRHFPAAILLLSLVLRFALAASGGQYYFGDEARYDRGLDLYRALASADFSAAATLAAQPEHTLFTWLGAVVSAAHHALAHLTPYGDWSQPAHAGFTIWLAAAVLSLFSTLNLALLHRLALRAGASVEEATWALLLMATASAAFYHARHLLPYDCALTAALAALLVGLGPPTLRRAFATGLLTGLTYHLYNGYWFLVPTVITVLLVVWRPTPLLSRRTLTAAAGLLVVLAAPLAFGTAVSGDSYWSTLRSFSASATQGLFAEGWSLPWEYLWHTEGPLGAALAALFLLTLVAALRTRAPLPPRLLATLLALATAYALLVLFSTVLDRFVVYGRTVKPLVPALCLLAAWALTRQLAARPALKPLAAVALLLVATLQFWPHFTRAFPRETEIAVLRAWGNPKRALTVSGSLYFPAALPVTRPDLVLVNAQFLYPARAPLPAPSGVTLLRVDHPYQYPPFQYEGHTPRERAVLRAADLPMRLLRLADPASVPDHPPPSLLYQPTDRSTGRQ